MPGHLDRQVPPLPVHDVEAVVIDVRALAGQVADHHAVRGPAHIPHHRRALDTRIMNTPGPTEWVRRYSSAIRCLRSPAVQSITGTVLAAAQARTRRAKRPARRIR